MSGIVQGIVLAIVIVVLVGLGVSFFLSPKSVDLTSIDIGPDLHVQVRGTAKNIKYLQFTLTTPDGGEDTSFLTLKNTHQLRVFPRTVTIDEKIPLPGLKKTRDDVYIIPEGTYKIVAESTADSTTKDEDAFDFQCPAVKFVVAPPDEGEASATPDAKTHKTAEVRITKATHDEVVVHASANIEIKPDYGVAARNEKGGVTITQIPRTRNEVRIRAINWCGKAAETTVSLIGPKITNPRPNQQFVTMEETELSFAVTATEGTSPYRYSTEENLPSGAVLDSEDGRFTWTPGSAGEHPVTLIVTDLMGRSQARPIQLVVRAPLRITAPGPGETLSFTIGEGKPFRVTAEGGTGNYIFSKEEGPAWIRVIPNTGELKWSTPIEGLHPVKIKVRDGRQSKEMAFYIQVHPLPVGPLDITHPREDQALPASESEHFEFTVSAEGGTGNYTFLKETGHAGASIGERTGQLTWARPVEGLHRFTVRVLDSVGNSDRVTFGIDVKGIGLPVIHFHEYPTLTNARELTITGAVKYRYPNRLQSTSLNLLDVRGENERTFEYHAKLDTEGENRFQVSVSDTAIPGNTHSPTLRIIRDTQPPQFIYNGAPTHQLVCDEDDHTTPISLRIADENSVLLTLTASWTATLPQPQGKTHLMKIQAIELPSGEHQLTAEDKLGHRSTVQLIKIGKLTVTLETPAAFVWKDGMYFTKETRIVLSGSITGGHGERTLRASTVESQTIKRPQGKDEFQIEVSLQEGHNTIEVTAEDSPMTPGDGRSIRRDSKPLTVIRDTTQPTFWYGSQPTTEIQRLIEEGDVFKVEIRDETSVTVNGQPLELKDGVATLSVQVEADLTKKGKNFEGQWKAKDIVGNSATLNIVVEPANDERERQRRGAITAFWAGRYEDAWNLLEALEQEQAATTAKYLLYRGMTTYEIAMKTQGKEADDMFHQAIHSHLIDALAKGTEGGYEPGSDEFAYNRFYLAMAFYQRSILAEQLGGEHLSGVEGLQNQAADWLELFFKNLEDKEFPKRYTDTAKEVLRELRPQALKVLKL